MVSLDKIVDSGTPSERALAALAEEHPADPQAILLRRAAYYGLGTPAMGTLCGVSAYWLFAEPRSFLLSLPGAVIGAIKAVEGVKQLSLTWQAWRERNQQCNFRDDESVVFYKVGEQYTASPTAAHVLVGERVYPVDGEALQYLPHLCLAYIADAQVATVTTTPYRIEVRSALDVPNQSFIDYLRGAVEIVTASGAELSWAFDSETKDLPECIRNLKAGQRYDLLARLQGTRITTIEQFYPPREVDSPTEVVIHETP